MKTNRPSADKQLIRVNMKKRREAMPSDEVQAFSERIINKLLQLKPLLDARVIMSYMSIHNEVDLGPAIEQLAGEGRILLLPRVEGPQIQAVRFGRGEEMRESPYGILEPLGPAWDVRQIDAVLVPGLAFDYQGYRIGYGMGYYDRFLPQLRKDAFLCGVCYEFQVIDCCAPDQKDHPVNWIVTERSELMIDPCYF